jgi:hypothetical protein
MEDLMAFVTGDVVPVSDDELPFKVIFKQGEEVLAEWLVESEEDGQAQIVETLKGLMGEDDEYDAEDDGDDNEDEGDDEEDEEDAA